VGERLLLALLDLAQARGAREATLEVRPSNHPARRLYEKYGFALVGVRRRYYSDDNEDALILTTAALDSQAMRDRITGLRAAVARRQDVEIGGDGLPVGRLDETEKGAEGGPAIARGILRPSSVRRQS
jgi:ribosomal-protein-alanine N-acetyltransferase